MGASGQRKPKLDAINNFTAKQEFSAGVKITNSNIELSTGTGTKIGTATNQKLSFHGVSPIVQEPANVDTSGLTLVNLEIEVNQLKQLLRNYGLMA